VRTDVRGDNARTSVRAGIGGGAAQRAGPEQTEQKALEALAQRSPDALA